MADPSEAREPSRESRSTQGGHFNADQRAFMEKTVGELQGKVARYERLLKYSKAHIDEQEERSQVSLQNLQRENELLLEKLNASNLRYLDQVDGNAPMKEMLNEALDRVRVLERDLKEARDSNKTLKSKFQEAHDTKYQVELELQTTKLLVQKNKDSDAMN